MKKLTIAVDCDDVLIDSTAFVVAAYNARYATNVKLENAFVSANPEWGVDRPEVFRRLHEIYGSDEFRRLEPRADARASIANLAQNHTLHLVTARDLVLELVTLQMLDIFFPKCFYDINHVGEGSKGSICAALNADMLVDDNAKHLRDALDCGVEHAVWFGEYPWQTHDLSDSNLGNRYKGWHEVEREVNRVAKR